MAHDLKLHWTKTKLDTQFVSFAPVLEQEQQHTLSRVFFYLSEYKKNGFPTMEQLADWMCMSPRTLQRRLQDAGYTYRMLLQEIKLKMALEMLETRRCGLSELAETLGFSDQGSFSRSFRKWTGQAPSRYLQAS
ncbi:MAG: helix-turn-helix transcriptional regulator [Sphingobacteriaceae bacterium]|nr:helix-turn-helix transcriptional regulator [Sphingobacteriaceae bacterium]